MLPEWLASLWLRIKTLFRRQRLESDLEDELEFHLAMREQKLVDEGMPPEEAHFAARRQFGNTTRAKEVNRDLWTFPFLETLWQDVRYAFRQLRRNPGFTIIAIITLALGIGATTSVYSVVNAVLLRPLPYKSPSQLVSIWQTGDKASQMPVAYPDFLDWRAQNHVFWGIAAYHWSPFMLVSPKGPLHVDGFAVSADLFSLLGVRPALGRGLLATDDEPGHHVVVLSYGLWQRSFNSNPKILGQGIRLDRTIFTVVGVMPAGFQFPIQARPVDVWVAQGVQDLGHEGVNRGSHEYEVIARMRPGVSLGQARAEMATIASRLARRYPNSNKDEGVKIVPEQQGLVRRVQTAILVLFGAVGLVLLIACANAANLLITRATNRGREIAIRAALGAGRRRIVRQLLTESLLLSLSGGALGMLLAFPATGFLARLGPRDVPRLSEATVSGPVLAFGLVVTLITGLVFGLGPALRCARADLNQSLKAGGHGTGGRLDRHGLRAAIVVGEVALTLLLLACGSRLDGQQLHQDDEGGPGIQSERRPDLLSGLFR